MPLVAAIVIVVTLIIVVVDRPPNPWSAEELNPDTTALKESSNALCFREDRTERSRHPLRIPQRRWPRRLDADTHPCSVLQGEIGLNAAHMVMELVKDNRKIVDRITHAQIDNFVDLLRKNKVNTGSTLSYARLKRNHVAIH